MSNQRMEMNMEQEQEAQTHTPLPWRIHAFRSVFSDERDRLALRCVGKSMTGRDWTAYVESEDGTTVLQTDGATEEEAIANAEILLSAVNNHDALIAEVVELRRMLSMVAPVAYTKAVIPHLPGEWADEIKVWLKGTRTEDVLRAAQEQ